MSNEITMKLKSSIEELIEILEQKGFKTVQKFSLCDTYFIPKNLNIKELNARQILSNAILLRDIDDYMQNTKIYKLTYKTKEIDEKGNILKQDKVDCEIINSKEGKKFIEAIGYKELIKIKENDIVYEKDKLDIAIKDIENGDNLIEVETIDNVTELNSIEKIIQKIEELNIPIYTNDYFVKKAEFELEKIL